MTTLIIYSIICYGICNIIIYSNGPFHMFKKMHEYLKDNHPILDEMMSCFICLPVWCGFLLSSINLLFFPYIAFTPMYSILFYKKLWLIIIFLDGMFTSGICWLIHTVQEAIERSNT